MVIYIFKYIYQNLIAKMADLKNKYMIIRHPFVKVQDCVHHLVTMSIHVLVFSTARLYNKCLSVNNDM